MASKQDVLRAELRMVDLEENLVSSKKSGKADRDLKLELREARRQYRELRDEYFTATGEVLTTLPPVKTEEVPKKKRWWN